MKSINIGWIFVCVCMLFIGYTAAYFNHKKSTEDLMENKENSVENNANNRDTDLEVKTDKNRPNSINRTLEDNIAKKINEGTVSKADIDTLNAVFKLDGINKINKNKILELTNDSWGGYKGLILNMVLENIDKNQNQYLGGTIMLTNWLPNTEESIAGTKIAADKLYTEGAWVSLLKLYKDINTSEKIYLENYLDSKENLNNWKNLYLSFSEQDWKDLEVDSNLELDLLDQMSWKISLSDNEWEKTKIEHILKARTDNTSIEEMPLSINI